MASGRGGVYHKSIIEKRSDVISIKAIFICYRYHFDHDPSNCCRHLLAFDYQSAPY